MIVIDTHVWVWWIDAPHRLSRVASRALRNASQIGVSAISMWEVARLAQDQRIEIPGSISSWLQRAIAATQVRALPLTIPVAAEAAQLGAGMHGDPCDRLIVATALLEHAALVSKDQRIRDSGLVETIW